MTKVIKINKPIITGDMNPIVITPTSKDTTYVFKNAKTAKESVLTFLPSTEAFVPCRKTGSNDLYLITIELNEQTRVVSAINTTIIKNYYKYANNENPNIVRIGDIAYGYLTNPNKCGTYYSGKIIKTILSNYNIAGKNNTTFNLADNSLKEPVIVDLGGNDTYNYSSVYSSIEENSITLMDIKGNDKYKLSNGSCATVMESKGNDKYTAKNSIIDIQDFKGKDKYNFTNSTINCVDIKGSDKYKIDGVLKTNEMTADILDVSGKDKYTVKNANEISIRDGITTAMAASEPVFASYVGKSGNDNYSISNVFAFAIEDLSGDDKYKLNNASNKDADYEKYYFTDHKGSDKYTISGDKTWLEITDSEGKDTYNIKGSYNKKKKLATYTGYTNINDLGNGKNTFNLNYAGEVQINTGSNTNVFNIKNSLNVEIHADGYMSESGKDKYTLTSNNYYNIYDCGITADSYNITKSGAGYIEDYGGNDTYTIDSLKFKYYEDDIVNSAGNHFQDDFGDDTLILKNTNKNNLVYMSDFYKENDKYLTYGKSLIIYDKSTQGYTYIKNFYSLDANQDFNGFGDGKIETIKAKSGKKLKTLDVSINSEYYTNLNNVKQDVVNWLTTQNHSGDYFGCVEDVLMYGTNEQKATLVTYFDGTYKA